jgi:NAD(P)H-dependent FMN reductase
VERNKNVLVIVGSTRAGRVCPSVAEWIMRIGTARTSFRALKMRLAPTAPALILPEAVIRDGIALNPDHAFGQHLVTVQGAFAELSQCSPER